MTRTRRGFSTHGAVARPTSCVCGVRPWAREAGRSEVVALCRSSGPRRRLARAPGGRVRRSLGRAVARRRSRLLSARWGRPDFVAFGPARTARPSALAASRPSGPGPTLRQEHLVGPQVLPRVLAPTRNRPTGRKPPNRPRPARRVAGLLGSSPANAAVHVPGESSIRPSADTASKLNSARRPADQAGSGPVSPFHEKSSQPLRVAVPGVVPCRLVDSAKGDGLLRSGRGGSFGGHRRGKDNAPGADRGRRGEALVPHIGFEPMVSALRGRCPGPLDECGEALADCSTGRAG